MSLLRVRKIIIERILPPGSYRTTIILNFALLAVVPLIILGIVLATLTTSELEGDAAARSLTLAQTLAAEIDTFLGHSEAVLRQVATVTGSRYYHSQSQLEEFLSALIKADSPLDSIYILDKAGFIIYAAPESERLKGFSMHGQPFFQKARGSGKVFWASPFIDLKTMRMTLPASLSFDSGMVVGYINLSLLQSITQRVHRGGRVYAFITDQTGVVIAHPDERAVFQRINESSLEIVRHGMEGKSETLIYEHAGEKFIGSVTQVTKTGWSVIVTQPTAEAFALSMKMKRLLLIGCVITFVLALCLALWNSRRILQPLSYLAGDTRRVAGGDYAFTPSLNHPYKELNELAHDLSLMTKAIQDREEELQKTHMEPEQRVEKRTADLQEEIFVRRQAEEALRLSEEKYRTLVENINDVLFSLDTRGFITYISPAIEQFSQYKADEVIGQPFARFIHPDDLPGLQESFKEKLRGDAGSFEFRIFAKDGVIHYVRTSSRPLWENGQLVGVTGLMTDITERKRTEEALRKANAELESFCYSVSHDLRAPLRGIDGWSLALMEDCSNQLNKQGRKYLEFVRMETQRIGKLIDCLLELSRVTRTDMIYERIDLSTLVRSIIARLKEAEPDRLVEFIIQPGLMVYGDASLLDVMMTNLFDNAWKFTVKHPSACIEFGRTEKDGQNIYFVRDDGIGFDMAYAGKLFGAFQRMHKASEFPGSGVGLATVQRIIHRHGGRVWAEAEVEKGTTVYFTL